MIKVNLYFAYQKDLKSTRHPDPSIEPGKEVQVEIRENCSMMAPRIVLKWDGPEATPAAYNYAYIGKFYRWYRVSDWEYAPPYWAATLESDPLATYENYIGKSTQYILRSSQLADPLLIDNMYPALTRPEVHLQLAAEGNPFTPVLADGCYVVGIVNDDADGVGAVGYYVFTEREFRKFSSVLMGDPSWAGLITEISEDLLKALLNPFQYVVSCMWFPFSFPVSAHLLSLPYGWWDLPGVECGRLRLNYMISSATFTVPKHPQADSRGQWLNSSQYSRYKIDWPPVGVIPLDPLKVGSMNPSSKLSVQIYTDAVTGRAVVEVIDTLGNMYHSGTAQIGVPIQLGQMNMDLLGAAVAVGTGVGGLLSMKPDFAGAVQQVGNAIDALIPDVQTSGANGMTSVYTQGPVMECTFLKIADDGRRRLGSPLCTTMQINNLRGFIICDKVRVDLPGAYPEEIATVKEAMEGGFYFEQVQT